MKDLNVLVVETDEEFGGHLAQRLTAKGCTVTVAGGVEGVGSLAHDCDVDVVLLDLGGFGREGLKIIKDVAETCPETRVILLSSSKDVALSIEAMKLGVFDEVSVPVDVDALMDKLLAARKLRRGAWGAIHTQGG